MPVGPGTLRHGNFLDLQLLWACHTYKYGRDAEADTTSCTCLFIAVSLFVLIQEVDRVTHRFTRSYIISDFYGKKKILSQNRLESLLEILPEFSSRTRLEILPWIASEITATNII